MNPLLSVIIVTHNSGTVLEACRAALHQALLDIPNEVIVVDNASAERPTSYQGDRLIYLKHNVGFARAVNLAASAARGNLLLLLNPDTEVASDAVTEAISTLEHAQGEAIVGARTYFPTGADNPFCYGVFPTLGGFIRLAFGIAFTKPLRREGAGPQQVDAVVGCFMLMRSATWRRLCGFDPRFFLYAEDIDFCMRAEAFGIHRLISLEAHVMHLGGFTPRGDSFKEQCFYTANREFMKKHWSSSAAAVGTLVLRVWLMRRTIASRALGEWYIK